MRRPAESFWLANLLIALTLFSCSSDNEIAFEPGVEELTIHPQNPATSNRSPTVSRDARVLAWIRDRGAGDWAGNRYCAVRWERPAPIDTLYYTGDSFQEIEGIDLSDDGRHLIGLLWEEDRARFFIKPEDGGSTRVFDVPSDYTAVKEPRWIDENRILFGALGPIGQGVWSWNPADDSITPLCVSHPNPLEQWIGKNPDLDRSGRWICFERRTIDSRYHAIICSEGSGEILLDLDGTAPQFWTITPAEEDGLLFIDSHRSLRGMRLSRNETFYIVQETSEYDISPDGRWLFHQNAALNLKLRDLRNLR